MRIVSAWLDGLSNWQFVVVFASCLVLGFAIAICVEALITGHVNLSVLVGFGVIYTVVFTSLSAWKRWR